MSRKGNLRSEDIQQPALIEDNNKVNYNYEKLLSTNNMRSAIDETMCAQ